MKLPEPPRPVLTKGLNGPELAEGDREPTGGMASCWSTGLEDSPSGDAEMGWTEEAYESRIHDVQDSLEAMVVLTRSQP